MSCESPRNNQLPCPNSDLQQHVKYIASALTGQTRGVRGKAKMFLENLASSSNWSLFEWEKVIE
jgi:hypothetical protein